MLPTSAPGLSDWQRWPLHSPARCGATSPARASPLADAPRNPSPPPPPPAAGALFIMFREALEAAVIIAVLLQMMNKLHMPQLKRFGGLRRRLRPAPTLLAP